MHLPAVTAKCALELVKDTVIFVKITELLSQVVVDIDRLHRLALHRDVPDLQGEVIS